MIPVNIQIQKRVKIKSSKLKYFQDTVYFFLMELNITIGYYLKINRFLIKIYKCNLHVPVQCLNG